MRMIFILAAILLIGSAYAGDLLIGDDKPLGDMTADSITPIPKENYTQLTSVKLANYTYAVMTVADSKPIIQDKVMNSINSKTNTILDCGDFTCDYKIQITAMEDVKFDADTLKASWIGRGVSLEKLFFMDTQTVEKERPVYIDEQQEQCYSMIDNKTKKNTTICENVTVQIQKGTEKYISTEVFENTEQVSPIFAGKTKDYVLRFRKANVSEIVDIYHVIYGQERKDAAYWNATGNNTIGVVYGGERWSSDCTTINNATSGTYTSNHTSSKFQDGITVTGTQCLNSYYIGNISLPENCVAGGKLNISDYVKAQSGWTFSQAKASTKLDIYFNGTKTIINNVTTATGIGQQATGSTVATADINCSGSNYEIIFSDGGKYSSSTNNIPFRVGFWAECPAAGGNTALSDHVVYINTSGLTDNVPSFTVNSTLGGFGVGNVSNYSAPVVLSINATPSSGYSFVNWSTSCNGTISNASNPSTLITLNSNISCFAQANFALQSPTVVNVTYGGEWWTNDCGTINNAVTGSYTQVENATQFRDGITTTLSQCLNSYYIGNISLPAICKATNGTFNISDYVFSQSGWTYSQAKASTKVDVYFNETKTIINNVTTAQGIGQTASGATSAASTVTCSGTNYIFNFTGNQTYSAPQNTKVAIKASFWSDCPAAGGNTALSNHVVWINSTGMNESGESPAANNSTNVSFVSQTPADITSLNVVNTPLNIQYNITTTGTLNTSSVMLYYKTNNSSNDISAYHNGTADTGWESDVAGTNVSTLWNWSFGDNEIYPHTENIKDSIFRNIGRNQTALVSSSDYYMTEYLNVSNTSTYGFYEQMWNSSTSAGVRVYACNNSSSTPNIPATNGNCVQLASIVSNGAYDHTHNNSGHRVVPFVINATAGTLAGSSVKVTANMYFLIRGNDGATINVSQAALFTRTGATKTTTNNGNAFTDRTYTADGHLHQYSGNNTFYYYVCANATTGEGNCTTVRSDLLDLAGLPPSAPVISSPTNGTYYKETGNIWINYTAAVSPNGYAISYYNITLRDLNNTIISTIQGNNSNNLSYSWNASAIANGQYIIGVKAFDNLSQSTVGTSTLFTLTTHGCVGATTTYACGETVLENCTMDINLTTTSTTCFMVNNSGISINCAGFSITGNNTTDVSYGIISYNSTAAITGTNISNCIIDKFMYGIGFWNTSTGHVNNATLTTRVPGGTALLLANGSNGNTVTTATITAEIGTALGVQYSSGNRMAGITASSLNATGMTVSFLNATTCAINSSNVTANYHGIVIQNGGNNSVRNLAIGTQTGNPVYLLTTADNTIANVTAISNNAAALSLAAGNTNAIANSTFTRATAATSANMVVNFNGTGNTVYNNTIAEGTKVATLLRIVSGGSNTFYWNNFTNTSGYYVNDTNGSNFYNTTVSGHGEGNVWFNVINRSISVYGAFNSSYGKGLYYGTSGAGFPYGSATSGGKFLGSGADSAPLTDQQFAFTNGSLAQIGTASLSSPPLWGAAITVYGSGTCNYTITKAGSVNGSVLAVSGASVATFTNNTTVSWACSDTGSPYSVRFNTGNVTEQYETVSYDGTSGDIRTRIYIGTGSDTNVAYSFSYAPSAPHYTVYFYSCAGTTNASCVDGAIWNSEAFSFSGGAAQKDLALSSNETVLVVSWTTSSTGGGGGLGGLWGTPAANTTGNDTGAGISTQPKKGSIDIFGFIIIAIIVFAAWKYMTKPKREK